MEKKFPAGQFALHVFFILICLTYILPFILLLSVSFSSQSALTQYGYTLIPKVFDISGYQYIFQSPTQLINSYKVTIIFSVVTVALALVVMSLLAYPLSRPNFKLKKVVTFYIFFTMLFGGGLVPSYIINTNVLKLGNTIWIYILPSLVSGWYVIVMRTFFQGLPESLAESAKIDGASEFRIYFSIILPLSTPVLATVGFMLMIDKWNDWYTALIYIRDRKLYSLQYMLQKILREVDFIKKMAAEGQTQFSTYEIPTDSMRYAMAILAAGPMLIVFPFFQKYFAKGLTVGAVKG